MPKLSQDILNCAFYLYSSVKDAQNGSPFGGTGFLVGVLNNEPHPHWDTYGVTNWHVAIKGGASIVRVNTYDGPPDILQLTPDEWTKHPDGLDIAVAPLPLDHAKHRFHSLSKVEFATRSTIRNKGIAAGEDVFMVGRFIDHDGGPTNAPAVRFGHISVMPTPVKQITGVTAESYCIDVHSRSGYSGSPVFVYRTPGSNFDSNRAVDSADRFIYLLGIHWGQFPERWEILSGEPRPDERAGLITEGNYVQGLSGMTCVLPVWNVMEALALLTQGNPNF